MKLANLFAHKSCVFSIEVFPPKKGLAAPEVLYPTLDKLAAFQPDFISVTYGAGGTAADTATCDIASYIKNTLGIEALAHLTCVNLDLPEVQQVLARLQVNQIENVLALRGDIPPGAMPKKDFAHASDLTTYIKAHGGFHVSGACYPEGHVESASLANDVENLRHKLVAGTTHLITQLFFDNGCYYRFLNMARKAGYTVPVSAGVMPITNARQVQRTVALSSASLPNAFTKMISRYDGDDAALFDAGIDYAVQQIRDLIIGGADGIHLYGMNNPVVVQRVYDGIADLLQQGSAT